MQRVKRYSFLLFLLIIWPGTLGLAQGPPGKPPFPPDGRPPRGPLDGPPNGNPFGFTLLASEMLSDGKVVKGAPFSATALTESVQVLADGTRISRKMSATFQRDAEGRTRREHKLENIGPLPIAGEPPHMVFINDVVTNTRYVLDLNGKTARRMPLNTPPPARPPYEQPSQGAAKIENLGKQIMEGVEVVGTKTTITIPTGAIGNDRPLLITSERWEAESLQVVLLSKHTDPRVGETIYRLTNLNRTAPARAQFEIPADFRLLQERPPARMNEPDLRPANRSWHRERKP